MDDGMMFYRGGNTTSSASVVMVGEEEEEMCVQQLPGSNDLKRGTAAGDQNRGEGEQGEDHVTVDFRFQHEMISFSFNYTIPSSPSVHVIYCIKITKNHTKIYQFLL